VPASGPNGIEGMRVRRVESLADALGAAGLIGEVRTLTPAAQAH
jgi:hypothetical protein